MCDRNRGREHNAWYVVIFARIDSLDVFETHLSPLLLLQHLDGKNAQRSSAEWAPQKLQTQKGGEGGGYTRELNLTPLFYACYEAFFTEFCEMSRGSLSRDNRNLKMKGSKVSGEIHESMTRVAMVFLTYAPHFRYLRVWNPKSPSFFQPHLSASGTCMYNKLVCDSCETVTAIFMEAWPVFSVL